jgi:Carboxypeptidase regulatory-like domain
MGMGGLKSRRRARLALAVAVVASGLWTTSGSAQTLVGQISGTVSDTSRAVLPGVTVSVTNNETQAVRVTQTDVAGAWIVTNLPPGGYTVTAELPGFKKAVLSGFLLSADGRLRADITLDVGGLAETVEVVSVRGDTVNRTSGEIARTIDGNQVRDLALNGRNYVQLASLVPGAALLNDDQLDLTTSLSTSGQSINGNRPVSNSLLVDGGTNNDSGSNASQINNVGIDFVREVQIQTSNFSAEYGRQAGAVINVVTRSGANRFSGSLFEFVRHDGMDAPNYFSPLDASGEKIKQKLRFHDYGGALGGPLRRDRFFFFVGQEYKYIRRQTNPFQRSLPTLRELEGDFSQSAVRFAGTDRIVGTADDIILRDPVTGQPFPNRIIPANRITPDGRAISETYRRMIQLAAGFTDQPVGNNTTFQLDNPFDWRQDIVRLDYRVNDRHSVFMRYLHDKYDLIEPLGTFSGSDLPTTPTNRLRPGTSYQLAYTWVVSDNIVNEVKGNGSWNGQRIPPVGEDWKRETYGYQFPQLFPGGRFDGIPYVSVTGLANFRGPSFSLLSPTTDIFVQNALTWVLGEHSLKTGVKYTRNRKDQNGRSTYLGDVAFNNTGNPRTTNNAFADALLGNFRTYTEASDDPLGFFRFNQYEAWVSDNWQVGPALSLEAGVRYQYAPPIYSQQNNLVNFDPALYDSARAVTMNRNGTIVPNTGDRFNGLIRAGSGIPDDQTDRVDVLPGPAYAAIPVGAERGLYDGAHLLMPRVSFAWSPTADGKLAIRGGFGVFYDRPEGNIIFSSLNLPPFMDFVQYENGNLANPTGGTAAALAPLGTISTIDPGLKTARTTQYSVSVQKELWGGYLVEAAYVGTRGRDLLWFPDINRPDFALLAANNALPAAQRASVNFLRPYKGYSVIQQRLSDAEANYNGLQVYANKRRGDFMFTVGYTLSKVNTNASGFGDNPVENDLAYNYGPATYDRRHIFVATYTYSMPFFRGRGGIVEAVLGGWDVSGITRIQSGPYLTPRGNTSTGERRADYVGGEVSLPGDERDETRWFNTAAFTAAPDTRFGNAEVGQIVGPGRHAWDLSFRKHFAIGATKLGVQADVFNLFNTLNLNAPNVVTTSADFGKINGAGPPRQVQLGIRLEF